MATTDIEYAEIAVTPRAPLIRPDDHYVLKKLANEVLPWMVAGRKLRSLWFVRMSAAYGYIGDGAAALAGLGIGAPVANLLSGQVPPGKNAIEVLTTAAPAGWLTLGIVSLIVWIVIRLIIQRENVPARALLARECADNLKALHVKLLSYLSAENPMEKIVEVQKTVDDRVQSAITSRIWPWDPLPDEDIIYGELAKDINSIRVKFMGNWPAPPKGSI